MFSNRTITLYLARHYIKWLLIVFAVFGTIVAIFDMIELLRRASGKADVGMQQIVQMSALKLPVLLQELIPFVILLGAMIAFWRLARVNELVIARATGMSPWQLIGPALVIAFLIGCLQITIANPFATTLNAEFERIETQYLREQRNQLALAKSGFWLREVNANHDLILHAANVDGSDLSLETVMALRLDKQDQLIERIDSHSATLKDGFWDLQDAYTINRNGVSQNYSTYRLRTSMSDEQVRESFASAEAVSFWDLPRFIDHLQETGFNAVEHRLKFHSLLSTPLLLCAMVLVAAVFSLRTGPRSRGAFLILGGVTSGFIFFFATQIVHALGLSTGVPVILAAWIPAGVMTMLGLSALLHLEDG